MNIMKKYVLLTVFTALGLTSYNQNPSQEEVIYDVIKRPNTAFTFGEKLTYRVHYGALTGGNCEFVVGDQPKMVGDKTTYHIKVAGKSTGLVDMMFGVKDEYESYMDV